MKHFDVIVVGAGPAGSSAAIALTRNGYSVGLIDKEQFPREKLCGDFVNPINWPLLRELGVAGELLSCPHEKITAFHLTSFSGAAAEVPLPSTNGATVFGLGVRRAHLDQVLMSKARSQNVTVLDGYRIKELKREGHGWRLTIGNSGCSQELGARLLIGADGRNSWIAHHLGLAGAAAPDGRSIGFQFRLKSPRHALEQIGIHLFPGGYAGVVGIDSETVNLCLAIARDRLPDHRAPFFLVESCLPQNPRLKEILARGEISGEVRSTYPLYFRQRRVHDQGVLLVGDAARVSEPVTGEGIYFALKSGELAAQTVDQAFRKSDFSARQLRSYDQEFRTAFRLRRQMNAMIRWLIYRPAMLNPLIRFSGKRRGLLDTVLHTICQPEPGR